MTYGIEIRNNNSEVQLKNDSYFWVCDKTEGSLSVTMPSSLKDRESYNDVPPYVYKGVYYVDPPSSPSLKHCSSGTIAIKLSSSKYYNIAQFGKSYDEGFCNGNFYSVWLDKIGVTGSASDSFTIPYAMLYYSVSVPDSGVFQVYWSDNGGEFGCIMSSEVRFPQLVGFYEFTNPMPTTSPGWGNSVSVDYEDVTVKDAVNNYFVLRTNSNCWFLEQTPCYEEYWNLQMTRTSSTNVRVSMREYRQYWVDDGGSYHGYFDEVQENLQLLEFKIPGLI